MTKKLNEAQYTLSVDGLETVDAEMLSQILSLAGRAEAPVVDELMPLSPMNDLTAGETMGGYRDSLDAEPEMDLDMDVDPMGDEGIPGELGADPVEELAEELSDLEDLEVLDDEYDDDDDLSDYEMLATDRRESDIYEADFSNREERIKQIMREAGKTYEEAAKIYDKVINKKDGLAEDADFTNRPSPHKYELSGMNNQSAPASEKKRGSAGDNTMADGVKLELEESYKKLNKEFEAFKNGR